MRKRRLEIRLAVFLAATLLPAMAGRIYAADFTPSVAAKSAPQVNNCGSLVNSVIYDINNQEVAQVPSEELHVTPVSKAEQASDEIKDRLLQAYERLNSEDALNRYVPGLEAYLEEMAGDITVEDLIIRDLFHLSLSEMYQLILDEDGNTIAVSFKLELSKEAPLVVLVNSYTLDGDVWSVVSQDNIKRGEGDCVTIYFRNLGTVAFLTDSGRIVIDPQGPKSPQTSEDRGLASLNANMENG